MPIEVKCAKCGKGLKAPESMAGKKAKCPGCGSIVVVPQPMEEILDAEIIEPMPVATSNLGSLLDDELAYRVAQPDPISAQTPLEERRQCPACGEMIVSTAAKCRFCGEIFDSDLRRKESRIGGKRRGGGRLNLASRLSRLGAVMLDGIMSMIFVAPGFIILLTQIDSEGHFEEGNAVAGIGGLALLIGICALGITQLVLLSSQGQTIGKKLASVRIVMLDDGSNPGFLRAVMMRGFIPGVISAIPYIGFIFSIVDILFIFTEDRRCLHDHIAGTIVVEA
jgi:uncharacterized RDD family membrane protein YckC/predicted RNA-binding Zn-ribbon protein involved in translation (DUF1610 family)